MQSAVLNCPSLSLRTERATSFLFLAQLQCCGAVLGISSQDVESHVEFKSKLDLPFRLLADEGGEVRKSWGVPKDLLGLLEGRQT